MMERLRALPEWWRAVAAIVALAAIMAIVPIFGSGAAVFFWGSVAVTALYAMSVNLLIGVAGIPSFGQAAYFGIGAYAVGVLHHQGVPILLVLLVAMLAAGLAATAVAALGLRATGLAFSMLTLAFAQALYTLVFQLDTFGGENGIVGLLPQSVLGVDLTDGTSLWLFTMIVVAAGIGGLWILQHSPFGRTLMMIREDPVRTLALGIQVRRYQIAAFAAAGAVAGLAGGLFAYVQGLVVPEYLFWTRSGEPILMSIIGGMRHFLGPVLGSVIYRWSVDVLSDLTAAWVLWVGLAFLVIVLAAPGGVLGLPAQIRSWRSRRAIAPPSVRSVESPGDES